MRISERKPCKSQERWGNFGDSSFSSTNSLKPIFQAKMLFFQVIAGVAIIIQNIGGKFIPLLHIYIL